MRQALYASKIIAYSQGFDAIVAGAEQYGWDIKKGDIAAIWRGGCIIRARFLNRITEAYAADPALVALVTAPFFADVVARTQEAWRRVVAMAAQAGIPSPAFSSSLAYYDGLRADRLPAALVQGQRDFFGAHTYKRVDKDGTFHTLWSGDRSRDPGCRQPLKPGIIHVASLGSTTRPTGRAIGGAAWHPKIPKRGRRRNSFAPR